MTKKILALIGVTLLLTNFTSAQQGDYELPGVYDTCVQLSYNLRIRARDATTNNEVSALQDFLFVSNYLKTEPTGYFGPASLQAVKDFQRANDLASTGYVGPLTRAKIKEISCSDTTTPPTYCPIPSSPNAPMMFCNGQSVHGNWDTNQCKYVCPSINTNNDRALSVTANIGGNPLKVQASFYLSSYCSDYTLTWGDGTNSNYTNPPNTYCIQSVPTDPFTATHVYKQAGTYTVTFQTGNTKVAKSITVGSAMPPTVSSLTVVTPNGGESIEMGQMYTVTWKPYDGSTINPANDVTVYLEKKNYYGTYDSVGKLMDEGKASLHTYWHLSDKPQGPYPTPGEYYIRVQNNVTGQSDRSDNAFKLTPQAIDLKINGTDTPSAADQYKISWTSYYSDINSCKFYSYGNTIKPLSYALESIVPSSGNDTAVISITDSSLPSLTINCSRGGKTVWDTVSLSGYTVPDTFLKIISPNGGETIDTDDRINVAWTFAGLRNVSIALYKNDMWNKWFVTGNSANGGMEQGSNYGSYSIDLSRLSDGYLANDGNVYKIYITGQKSDGSASIDDKSDTPFKFITTPGVHQIIVISPNGGEVLTKGTSANIAWSYPDNPINKKVVLKLLKSGQYIQEINSPGGPITTGPYGSTGGSLPWTVPTTLADGADYTIEAWLIDSNSSELLSADVSNSTFTITGTSNSGPTISGITGSNTTGTVYANQKTNVSWRGASASSIKINETVVPVTILAVAMPSCAPGYSSCGSTMYEGEFTMPNLTSGSYMAYLLNSQNQAGPGYLVTVNAGGIVPTSGPIISSIRGTGSGTSNLYTGEKAYIDWKKGDASSLTIGNTTVNITNISYALPSCFGITNCTAEAFYSGEFIVPNLVGGPYKVALLNSLNQPGPTYDVSIKTAAVSAPAVTVTSPNGGERFSPGQPLNVYWTTNGLTTDGWIQLQLRDAVNQNAMIKLIVGSVPASNNSLAWTIPSDVPNGNYLIWATVGDLSGSKGIDFSDSSFKITTETCMPSNKMTYACEGGGGATWDTKTCSYICNGTGITPTYSPTTSLNTNPLVASAYSTFIENLFANTSVKFEKHLSFGMRNNIEVKKLQVLLMKEGFLIEDDISGNFLDKTKTAVKRLQNKYGLEAVGTVGPLTRDLLNKVLVHYSE